MALHTSPDSGRYTAVAQVLHWITAALVLLNLLVGWRMGLMHGLAEFQLFQLHKSFGITVLLLTAARLGWRLSHRAPALPAAMNPAERAAAHVVHVLFYLLLLALPLSGWALVSASPHNIPTVLYHIVPWPYFPGVHALAGAARHAVRHDAGTIHYWLVWTALSLIALHVAGALKHQLEPAARVLPRMVPRHAGAIAVVGVAVVAAVVLAVTDLAGTSAAPTRPTAALAPVAAAPDADAWVVDMPASSLGFEVAVNGDAVTGHFSRWSAAIVFDPTDLPHAHVDVRIDTGSARTGDDTRDGMLPSADWFDIAAFPQARFTADRFAARGPGAYEADGTLTIRGHAQTLALRFTLAPENGATRMQASVPIDRRVFGVGQGQFAGTDSVAGVVTLRISLLARKR